MVNHLMILLVIVQCFVIGGLAWPSARRTVDVASLQNFNSSQLIKTVQELMKEPGKFRRVATISLLMGAIRSEEQMEKELLKLTNDLLDTFNTTSLPEKEKKLNDISKFVQRDLRAMFILSSAIDLTQYNASVKEFQNAMKEFTLHGEELAPRLDRDLLKNGKTPSQTIREFVNDHIQVLRNILINRVALSIETLEKDDDRKRGSKLRPIVVPSSEGDPESNSTLSLIGRPKKKKTTSTEGQKRMNDLGKGIKTYRNVPQDSSSNEVGTVFLFPHQEEILTHLEQLDRDRREDDDDDDEFKPEEQEGPGGLVGLIANLSGGDEGSDVGAVLGAITGVVARLLGPGGLDINGLLSTGTSLLAGLLGGDVNFGKVLAGYVGTSLDGLSGGGGADNNGLFVGNIIGGVLSSLSADPEDEDVNPIKPGIFLSNVITGAFQGLAKDAEGEDRRDRKVTLRREGSKRMMEMMESETPHHMGSDVFGFIVGVIRGVIGGVKSIVVNSIAGLSSGASKGSMNLAMKVVPVLSTGSDGLAAAITT